MSDVRNLRFGICDVCLKPICQCPKPDPHALTREQVEKMGFTIHSADEFGGDSCYQVLRGPGGLDVWITEPEDRNFHRDLFPLVQLIACQHQALAQQAQEVERIQKELDHHVRQRCYATEENLKLKQEVERLKKEYIRYELECHDARRQLAAMTAERDEACGELLVSLDDAPIGSLAGKLVTANRVLRSQLATLQATLAEREELVEGLKTELEEYRSLAEKLGAEKAISERDIARQDAARLRKALEAVLPIVKEVAAIEQAQRALKGA